MKKRTKVPHLIKECIACGINTPADIAKETGFSLSHIVSVTGEMVRDKDLMRVKINGASVLGFAHGNRLHDPFNLCKPAAKADRTNRVLRKTPTLMPYKHFKYSEAA